MASSIPASVPAEAARPAAAAEARGRRRRVPWLVVGGLGFVGLLIVVALAAP